MESSSSNSSCNVSITSTIAQHVERRKIACFDALHDPSLSPSYDILTFDPVLHVFYTGYPSYRISVLIFLKIRFAAFWGKSGSFVLIHRVSVLSLGKYARAAQHLDTSVT